MPNAQPIGQPEIPSNIPQEGVPMDPGVPQEAMPMDQGDPTQQMATPEQKQELLDMIETIKGRMSEVDAGLSAGKDQVEKTRSEMVKKVFEILQLAGVDLNSRESVAEFLGRLREQNPQLADWFESSIDILLGGETVEPQVQAPMGEGLPPVPGELPGAGLETPGGIPGEIPGGIPGAGLETIPNENEYENTGTINEIPKDIPQG